MKNIRFVFFRVLVAEFYRQNALFFGILLLFSFGILRPVEHISLATLATKNTYFLSLFLIIWSFYTCICLAFIKRCFALPQNAFLQNLRTLNSSKRYLLWIETTWALLSPILIYAIFTGIVAWREKQFLVTVIIVFSIFGLWFLCVSALDFYLKKATQKENIKVSTTSFNFPKSLYWIYVEYLFRKQSLILFLSKSISYLAIFGITWLYPTDDYDERLLFIGGIIVGLSQMQMLSSWQEFRQERLIFLSNLPISRTKRILQGSILLFILLIPELIFMVRYLPEKVSYWKIPLLVVFIWAVVFKLDFWIQSKKLDQDKLMQHGFWLLIIGFLLIMFKVPIWILVLVLLVY